MGLLARRLDDYELRQPIGHGSAGVVWDAWDAALQRRTAVKIVRLTGMTESQRADIRARFRQEAAITASMKYPGLLDVYRYGETAEEAYLAMEFVVGETLQDSLRREGRLSVERSVQILTALLLTLDHCHDRGIVHRDIKPSNVMLPQDGGTKLADFGVARLQASDMTTVGMLIGTLAYMSPEQFTATAPVDARTDIWSCGVLLYELLTGQRPFRGELTAVMQQVLQITPPPPSSLVPAVSAALDGVVAQALARQREDRFQTARAFANALRAALPAPDDTIAFRSTVAIPAAVPPPPPRPSSRRRLLLAGGAGGLLLLAIAGIALVWQTGGNRASTPVPPSGMPPAAPSIPEAPALPAPTARPPVTHDIAADIGQLRCAAVYLSKSGPAGLTEISGVIGEGASHEALEAMRARHPDKVLRLDVQSIPANPANCRLIELMRPFQASAYDAARIAMSLSGEQAELRTDDEIRLRLRMPDFDGYLHMAYIDAAGTVALLGRTQKIPETGRAGAWLGGDDGKPDIVLGVVGEPYGTDLIVAIVSARPLFAQPPDVAMGTNFYAAGLAAAVAAQQRDGARLAARIVVLRTARR